MDVLNSYKCSYISGMSKVFFLEFSMKYKRHFSSLVVGLMGPIAYIGLGAESEDIR